MLKVKKNSKCFRSKYFFFYGQGWAPLVTKTEISSERFWVHLHMLGIHDPADKNIIIEKMYYFTQLYSLLLCSKSGR